MLNISVPRDDPISRDSFTLCLRFYLEILGITSDSRRGYIVQIPGLLKLRASFPNREFRC